MFSVTVALESIPHAQSGAVQSQYAKQFHFDFLWLVVSLTYRRYGILEEESSWKKVRFVKGESRKRKIRISNDLRILFDYSLMNEKKYSLKKKIIHTQRNVLIDAFPI